MPPCSGHAPRAALLFSLTLFFPSRCLFKGCLIYHKFCRICFACCKHCGRRAAGFGSISCLTMKNRVVKIVVQSAYPSFSVTARRRRHLGKSEGYQRQLRHFGELFFHLLVYYSRNIFYEAYSFFISRLKIYCTATHLASIHKYPTQ
jgi:hypothetical protein